MINQAYDLFREAFIAYARHEFISIQARHPTESFYAFMIWTPDDILYLDVYGENWLTERVETVIKYSQLEEVDQESLRKGLRWMHHVGYLVEFPNPLKTLLFHYYTQEKDYWADQYNQLMELSIETLQILDAEGVFGEGKDRQKVVLNLRDSGGDESYDWLLKNAQRLNPPSVVERYHQELLASAGKTWLRK